MKNAIDTVRSQVTALNPDEVKEVKVEVSLAVHNAELGIAALEPHEDVLQVVFRKYVSPVIALRALIAALVDATRDVDDARPMPSGARELSRLVYADREKLLAQLTAWSLLGLAPQHAVDRIKEGHGLLDASRDVLVMVLMINRSPEMKSRSLVSPEVLAEMKERASKLVAVARPTGRRPRANPALTQAIDTQARVWTLFVRQHDLLWQDAVRIFGRKVDQHVPPLGSRVVTKRKLEAAEPVDG